MLLLDEPLGALDAKLRRSLKVELKALQERVGITFLYVTHDQEEALTMSDRLAVMNAGKIVQIGTPREVYEEPADTYVADFLGVSNLMEVDVVSAGRAARCAPARGWALTSALCEAASDGGDCAGQRARGDPAGAGADRGARLGRGRTASPPWWSGWSSSARPRQVLLRLAPGVPLQALVQNDGEHPDLAQGTPVHVYLPPDALRVLAGAAGEVPVAEDESLVAS